MPKIGDFGVFRDDKGDESPCVVTRALDDGHVDLHLFHTNMRDIEVAMGGPRTVTVIGNLEPDWASAREGAAVAVAAQPSLVSLPQDFSDPRISPPPAAPLTAVELQAVADSPDNIIPVLADPPKPEGE